LETARRRILGINRLDTLSVSDVTRGLLFVGFTLVKSEYLVKSLRYSLNARSEQIMALVMLDGFVVDGI
jgi:hypothetical protein